LDNYEIRNIKKEYCETHFMQSLCFENVLKKKHVLKEEAPEPKSASISCLLPPHAKHWSFSSLEPCDAKRAHDHAYEREEKTEREREREREREERGERRERKEREERGEREKRRRREEREKRGRREEER